MFGLSDLRVRWKCRDGELLLDHGFEGLEIRWVELEGGWNWRWVEGDWR